MTAVATLTYVYAEQTAVLGALATFAEPHTYDLCSEHAERLTAPVGWQVVRLVERFAPSRSIGDDLFTVADAVRSATDDPTGPGGAAPTDPAFPQPTRGVRGRRHLRVLPAEGDAHVASDRSD